MRCQPGGPTCHIALPLAPQADPFVCLNTCTLSASRSPPTPRSHRRSPRTGSPPRSPPPAATPPRLQGPDRAALELHHGHERVVHVRLARALAVETRAMLDERPGQRADGLDLADEVAAEVDDVRAQVAQRARPRELLLQAPDERH